MLMMSSNRVRNANWSANSRRISLIPSADISISKKRLLRSPRTPLEKILCYILSFSFVVVMVLIAALCIISDRWKATLSKLPYAYLKEDTVCDTEACFESAQKLLSSLDPSTDPCEDFYQYACGGWIEKNPIPEGRQVYMAYDLRKTEVADIVVDLLESLGDNVTQPRALVSLGNFYRGCRDAESRERVGVEPLRKLLSEMGGWPMVEGDGWSGDGFSWYRRVAQANRRLMLNVMVEIDFTQDVDDNKIYRIRLDRGHYIFSDYYVEVLENPDSNVTESLVGSIVEAALMMGSGMGRDQLREEARKLVIFEYGLVLRVIQMQGWCPQNVLRMRLTSLGGSALREHIAAGASENEDNIYDMTVGELQENITERLENYRDFSYVDLLNLHLQSEAQVTEETAIYVQGVDYFAELPGFIDKVNKRHVANYISYWILNTFASYTVEELWSLVYQYERDWMGRQTCTSITKTFMSYALSRLYLDKNFSPLNRYHVKKMVEMIRLAYSSTLDQNAWMDKNTMLYSVVKLQSIDSMIGYPEWISDNKLLDKYYEKVLDIEEGDYFGAILKLCILSGDEKYRVWNKTADRNDTLVPHNPRNITSHSECVLFTKSKFYGSINYGGIGTVIGHEISHAFDAFGRLFDHEGNLRNWWTKETRKKFLKKAQCFAEQYENFVDDDHPLKVDGNFTLSENIADNGAIRNAFKAFRLHLALSDEYMNNRKVLPGLPATPEQLFFLGYASVWCANMTDDYARGFKHNDEHSPNKLRVNIPLANFREFAKAFKCDPGTPMNPRHKCILW